MRKKRSSQSKRSGRTAQADRLALEALDRLLTSERAMEARYALPFRMPHNVATTLHDCTRCYQAIALLIFGDNAKDVDGLRAYARMMNDVIHQHNLPTYIIAPPTDPSSPDNSALLLKVWPTEEATRMITPDQWEHLIADLSSAHCPDRM